MTEPLAPNTAQFTITFEIKYDDRSAIVEQALKNLESREYLTPEEAEEERQEILENFEVALLESFDPMDIEGESGAFEVTGTTTSIDAIAPDLTPEDVIRIEKEVEAARSALIDDGARLSGLEFIAESLREAGEGGEEADEREVEDFRLIRGLVWSATQVVIDELFDAVASIEQAQRNGWALNVMDLPQVWQLPPRYRDGYDLAFVRRFLVTVADVSARLADGWTPLPTVAHELALRLILDETEIVAESHELELFDGWRALLEEYLFEDPDHEFLYAPALDGIDEDPNLGMASLKFDDWFVPFNSERHPSPYAAD